MAEILWNCLLFMRRKCARKSRTMSALRAVNLQNWRQNKERMRRFGTSSSCGWSCSVVFKSYVVLAKQATHDDTFSKTPRVCACVCLCRSLCFSVHVQVSSPNVWTHSLTHSLTHSATNDNELTSRSR